LEISGFCRGMVATLLFWHVARHNMPEGFVVEVHRKLFGL
jgi:hypothetical protein